MAAPTYTIPTVGAPHSTEDPKVRTALSDLKTLLNGNLDSENLADGAITADKIADALAEQLGILTSTTNGRGYDAVATEESTTSTSYTDLSTAGPSVSIDVPANGFVYVYAEADIKCDGYSGYVGLYEATDYASAQAIMEVNSATYVERASAPGSSGGTTRSTNLSGFIQVPATQGARTYTMKYKVDSSGTAYFKNRKLWVIGGGPA